MICASNATPNAEGEAPMSAFIKTLVLITTALSFGLISDASFGAELLKFSYITTIYAAQTGTAGQDGTPLKQPEGLACDDQSHVIVADTGNGRLLRYVLRDQTISGGSPAIKMPELALPTRVQLNSKGEIFVLDRKTRRIVRLTTAGAFIGDLNPTGLTPPTYVPRSFFIDRNDLIYILDIFSERILVLNSEGRYLSQKKFPQDYGFLSDLTVDFKGSVFLIDSIKAKVFSAAKDSAEFSPLTQSLKEYMRFPTAITTDNRGHMYLVDHNGGSVIILGPDGSYLGRLSAMGWREGLLNYPSQLCINNSGKVFIADTNNNRIQVFAIKE
jgi:DNA-binding beta-propeller fold protein YncE